MNRYSSLLLSVLLLILGFSAYAFLTSKINSAAASAAADEAASAATGAQQSMQQNTQRLLTDTESERAELDTYIVKDADIVFIIQEIEDAAKRENVSVTVGSVLIVQGSWRYHEPLEVTLSGTGTFSALAAFATDLESLPQASHLSRVSASLSDKNQWIERFTVDFAKEKTTP